MSPEHKKKLFEAYKNFNLFSLLCKKKNYIKIIPPFSGIEVLEKNEHTDKLKEVILFLKPGGFKWIENGVDILAK